MPSKENMLDIGQLLIEDTPKDRKYTSKEDIAENFFFLDEKHTSLLEHDEVVSELLRRVTVFFDALENAKGIYDTFADAYVGTPYRVSNKKDEYIRGIAQGFLSLILFGNDQERLEEPDELKYITDKISKLLGNHTNEKVKEIISKLTAMLRKGYPHLHINRLGFLNEMQTEVSKIFQLLSSIYDGEINLRRYRNVKTTDLFSDLLIIKRKFLKIAYRCYTGTEQSYLAMYGKDISYTEFCTLLDKFIHLLPYIQEVQVDESALINSISPILSHETQDQEEDPIVDGLLQKHIQKYSMFQVQSREYEEDIAPVIDDPVTEKEVWRQCSGGIMYDIEGIKVFSGNMSKVMKEYNRYKTLKCFDKNVGHADYEMIQKEKEYIGAKGAYLNEVNRFLNKLNTYRMTEEKFSINHVHYESQVPRYEAIDIHYYHQRKETGIVDQKYFKQLYASWEKKKVQMIVRSSAIKSEDNENTTGAGIYHSQVLPKHASYEEFCAVVVAVYISCDSPSALAYREENAIESESMGVVLQEYICHGMPGHANSIMPHRPELLEISFVTEKRTKTVLKKEHCIDSVFQFMSSARDKIFHGELDWSKLEKNTDMDIREMSEQLAYMTSLLERYFRKPIQVEFVVEVKQKKGKKKEETFWYHKEKKIQIVQVRPLPTGLETKYDIEFPDKEPLREGHALGVCDAEYEVLETGDANRERVGLVSFNENNQASINENFLKRSIPKAGVVVIRKGGSHGHIETLCGERDVVCLFSDEEEDIASSRLTMINTAYGIDNNLFRDEEKPEIVPIKTKYTDFYGHKKVRVVADGLYGRIYAIEEVSHDEEDVQKIDLQ